MLQRSAPAPWVIAPAGPLAAIERVALVPYQVPVSLSGSQGLSNTLHTVGLKVAVGVAVGVTVLLGPPGVSVRVMLKVGVGVVFSSSQTRICMVGTREIIQRPGQEVLLPNNA